MENLGILGIVGSPRCGSYNRARLDRYDKDRMKRLLRRYLGEEEEWDARFVEILDDRDYVFIRFVAETVVVRNQSFAVNKSGRIY